MVFKPGFTAEHSAGGGSGLLDYLRSELQEPGAFQAEALWANQLSKITMLQLCGTWCLYDIPCRPQAPEPGSWRRDPEAATPKRGRRQSPNGDSSILGPVRTKSYALLEGSYVRVCTN